MSQPFLSPFVVINEQSPLLNINACSRVLDFEDMPRGNIAYISGCPKTRSISYSWVIRLLTIAAPPPSRVCSASYLSAKGQDV